MKKHLFLIALAISGTVALQAQRLVLYEEFSGEKSMPSAMANPALSALMAGNPSKAILVKYQTPLPLAGTLYNQNISDVLNRMNYYGVSFVPSGREDGKVLGVGIDAGHVNYLNQTEIDNEYAIPSSFAITASHTWSADGDSIYANINVTCISNFAPAGAQMRLRTALVEHLSYQAAPEGTNGEVDFPNVMRKMYPDANGIAVPNSWTTSQSMNYQVSGPVASFVNKSENVFLVVWLQNETDKIVAQAGKSTPNYIALDAGSQATRLPVNLFCTASYSPVTVNVSLKNAGTNTLTSAQINYKVDNDPWLTYGWTGNLVAGGSVNVSLPTVLVTFGQHLITDSVALPNNVLDINTGNSKSSASVWVHNTTLVGLPQSTDFESGGFMPVNWMVYDANGNGQNWALIKGQTTNIGFNNSVWALYHNNYVFNDTEVNYIILPQTNFPTGTRMLDFAVAYAQYKTRADSISVVYSTNCGQTWTTVWTQGGGDLATAPPDTLSFIPNQSQWQFRSVDITGIPNNTLVALRARSEFGNNLYIDNIGLRNTTGIKNIIAENSLSVYPNPAKELAHLSFMLNENSTIQVLVTDALGRVVSNTTNQPLTKGRQQLDIPVSGLAPGIYRVMLRTAGGNARANLSVVK